MKKYKELVFFLLVCISHLLGTLLVGSALVPGYFLVTWTIKLASSNLPAFWVGLLVCLAIGAGYFLFIDALLVLIVLTRHILGLKNKESDEPIMSRTGIRLGTYNWLISIAKQLALPMVRTTPIIVWFYRGMGAKIGKNTLISTSRLWDCDLIEIGRNSVIGGNVAIAGHLTTTFGRGILKKVKIGDRVSIGADSMIYPGVTIEDNVIVAPCSMIPMDSHLEGKSVYAGVPVQKIR